MRFVALLAILALALGLVAAPGAADPRRPYAPKVKDCPAPATASAPRKGMRAARLGELPSGQLTLSVWREVGGCPAPAVLRTGIGGSR